MAWNGLRHQERGFRFVMFYISQIYKRATRNEYPFVLSLDMNRIVGWRTTKDRQRQWGFLFVTWFGSGLFNPLPNKSIKLSMLNDCLTAFRYTRRGATAVSPRPLSMRPQFAFMDFRQFYMEKRMVYQMGTWKGYKRLKLPRSITNHSTLLLRWSTRIGWMAVEKTEAMLSRASIAGIK